MCCVPVYLYHSNKLTRVLVIVSGSRGKVKSTWRVIKKSRQIQDYFASPQQGGWKDFSLERRQPQFPPFWVLERSPRGREWLRGVETRIVGRREGGNRNLVRFP